MTRIFASTRIAGPVRVGISRRIRFANPVTLVFGAILYGIVFLAFLGMLVVFIIL